jgi:hypothetical protein
MPVVAEREGQLGVVGSLDDDLVGHEIGAHGELQGLDDILALRFASRETEHSELLVRAKHDEIRAENDSLLLELKIVELDSRVVRCLETDDSSLITDVVRFRHVVGQLTLLVDLRGNVWLAGLSTANKFLNVIRQMFLPKRLVSLKKVGLAFDPNCLDEEWYSRTSPVRWSRT